MIEERIKRTSTTVAKLQISLNKQKEKNRRFQKAFVDLVKNNVITENAQTTQIQ